MQSLRGIVLVVFSMAAFALEDALIKDLTSRQPIGQVILTLGFGGALVFFVIAGDAGRVWILRALAVPQVLVRTLAEAGSAATFVTALSLVPISTVAAVFQATPLAVAAGAALVFGERVGWRRWTAIVVGFAGVLLIIRPGLDGFRPEAMLVLLTVVSIALRDLVTRRIPPEVPSVAIAFHGFFALVLTGALILAFTGAPVRPPAPDLARLGAAVLFGTAGYYAIVAAMRLSDASILMPFRYARLIFSLIIGVTVFSERPDALTLTGAGVILAAAFYTYLRERKLALTNASAE